MQTSKKQKKLKETNGKKGTETNKTKVWQYDYKLTVV